MRHRGAGTSRAGTSRAGPLTGPSAAELAAALNQRISDVAARLGLRGEMQGHDLVCVNPNRADRNPGSFRITVTGAQAGRWVDYALPARGAGSCLGGDALDLVAYITGRDITRETRKAACAWARDYLGLGDGTGSAGPAMSAEARAAREAELARARAAADEKAAGERLKRVEIGRAIWLKAAPDVLNTPVETYLLGRGIDLRKLAAQTRPGRAGPVRAGVPEVLRFAPLCHAAEAQAALPAMVVPIVGPHGVRGMQGCHRTWLARPPHTPHADTPSWVKAPLKSPRKALGIVNGGYVPVWRGAPGRKLRDAPEGDVVCLWEGVEDALSGALAAPALRHLAAISLGNMSQIVLPEAIRTVIIGGENDVSPQAVAARHRAMRRFIEQGREVREALPALGKDANDLLRGMA